METGIELKCVSSNESSVEFIQKWKHCWQTGSLEFIDKEKSVEVALHITYD
jgi:hypothetical protein